MKQQGVARHLVTPRTLLFLQREGRWLFIEGAAHKWWAGRLNGIGGSVEADEDVLSAARRECEEETGLRPTALQLAAIIHVRSEPPVMLFSFTGALPPGALQPCDEGTFRWLPAEAIHDDSLPFMPDLPFLLPRLWARHPSDPPLFFRFRFSPTFEAEEGTL